VKGMYFSGMWEEKKKPPRMYEKRAERERAGMAVAMTSMWGPFTQRMREKMRMKRAVWVVLFVVKAKRMRIVERKIRNMCRGPAKRISYN
jgi:hypothetical protein